MYVYRLARLVASAPVFLVIGYIRPGQKSESIGVVVVSFWQML